MRSWKSGEKSRLMSTSSNAVRRRLVPSLVALALACLILAGTAFAWFALMQASYGSVHIDSNGIKIAADLWYVNDVNYVGVPPDSEYTAQARDTARIEQSGECYAGSTLHYKINVQNISDEEDVSLAVPVNLAFSLSPVGAYFDALVDKYMQDPQDQSIFTDIAANNGVILAALSEVSFVVYTGTLDPDAPRTAYALPEDTHLFSAYEAGESLFTYEGLDVGESIAVYLSFECLDTYSAVAAYQIYRNAQAQALAPTDAARAAAILAVTTLELNSLVIEPIVVGTGQTAAMSNAYLNIEYFSVFATENISGLRV